MRHEQPKRYTRRTLEKLALAKLRAVYVEVYSAEPHHTIPQERLVESILTAQQEKS